MEVKCGERLRGHIVIAESRWGNGGGERPAVIRKSNMLLKLHHRSCIINAFCLFLGAIQSTAKAHSIREKIYLMYKDGAILYGTLISKILMCCGM